LWRLGAVNFYKKVFKTLIDQYVSGQDTTLLNMIDTFITAEGKLQQVSNPSGTISSGGLGEPKFNIDGSAFTGPWGRSVIEHCSVASRF
jgi:glucoamylase